MISSFAAPASLKDQGETLPQSYSDYEKLMQRPSIIPMGLGKTMIASGMMRDYMQIVDGDLERACPGISRNPSPVPSLHQATGAETPGAG